MAQVWVPPELIAMRVPSVAVGLACPSVLRPQQAAVPLLLMAHEWESPALIEVMVPSPAGTVPRPLESRPQQAAAPSALIAHAWHPPTPTPRTDAPGSGALSPEPLDAHLA